jgi:hypothetical protein
MFSIQINLLVEMSIYLLKFSWFRSPTSIFLHIRVDVVVTNPKTYDSLVPETRPVLSVPAGKSSVKSYL